MTAVAQETHVSPLEARKRYAQILAGVLQVDEVATGSHFFDDLGADSMSMARFCARVRKAGDLPTVAMRDIYEHASIDSLVAALVLPSSAPSVAAAHDLAPQGARDRFAQILAGVLQVDEVATGSHFFDDLGADSMSMARFCARVRKAGDLPTVAMRDIYEHASIDDLVEALVTPASDGTAASSSPVVSVPVPPPVRAAGGVAYVLCGAGQLIFGLTYASLGIVLLVMAYEWVAVADGWVALAERAFVAGDIIFVIPVVLSIVLKWLIVGRWRPSEIRIWSLQYFRFWVVRTIVHVNPMVRLLQGSPLYAVYLRALGAQVGPGTVIFAKSVPVCTDLLTIGEGAVIHKDALLSCYRAEDGVIQTDRVRIGARAVIGVQAVLDVDTSMGSDSQLGHASCLQRGQRIPDGQSWSGSPAEPTSENFRLVGEARPIRLRRFLYSVWQLCQIFVVLPIFFAIVDVLLNTPLLAPLLHPDVAHVDDWPFYVVTAAGTAALMIIGIPVGLLVIYTVPRLLNRFVPLDIDIRLYGPRYVAHHMISVLTNVPALGILFGDTSYVVNFLKILGYRLDPVVQTGANLGQEFKHDNPFLCTVGTGTMIADGISFANATYSSSTFRVSHVSIGARSFLGNAIVYPADSRVGDDVLLGTKVVLPVEGEIQEHTGLLGAPSVRIPRTVRRDGAFVVGRGERRRSLHDKNRHNIRTMCLHLFARWIILYVGFVAMIAAVDFYPTYGLVVAPALLIGMSLFTLAFWIVIERLCIHLQLHTPEGRSIYDPAFWDHERFWKIPSHVVQLMGIGTPLAGLVFRLSGAKVGRRLYSDGLYMSERSFVSVGDDCTFNAAAHIQGHSQEDGAFKSDRIVIGSRCTLGVASFVHYGTAIGDRVTLDANSFLMKGEEIPDGEHWIGNPAQPAQPGQRPLHAES